MLQRFFQWLRQWLRTNIQVRTVRVTVKKDHAFIIYTGRKR